MIKREMQSSMSFRKFDCKTLKFGGPFILLISNFQKLADIYLGYFLEISFHNKGISLLLVSFKFGDF